MKYILIICMSLFLITIYLISDYKNDNQQNEDVNQLNKSHEVNNQNDLVVNTRGNNPDPKKRNKNQIDEISDFNEHVRNKVISSFGYRKGRTILDELLHSTSAVDADESDIENAVKKINSIQDNPESKSLIIRELYSYCEALEHHLKNSNNKLEKLNRNKIRGKFFLIALNRSGFCDAVGTEDDPFFIILKLARKGDQMSQLFLIDDFHQAIQRNLIDPKLYPVEYNNLRQEIISYLEHLSAQGIEQATLYLIYLFDNNSSLSKLSQYYPEDKVLHYFYLVRYENQNLNNGKDLPWTGSFAVLKSPFQIYQSLSEQQKKRADRMLERAGY